MKNLLTLVAAIAITSVASAQRQGQCTFTSEECGTVTRVYETAATRTVKTPTGVNIVNRRTGEVIDNYECDSQFRVTCSRVGAPVRTPRTPRTPFPTRPTTPRSGGGSVTITGSTTPGGTITSSETVTSTGGVNIAIGTVTATAN